MKEAIDFANWIGDHMYRKFMNKNTWYFHNNPGRQIIAKSTSELYNIYLKEKESGQKQ